MNNLRIGKHGYLWKNGGSTHTHSSTQLTPYEVAYGQPPPIHFPYSPGDSHVDEVDRSSQRREEMLQLLKFYLLREQTRMKQQAGQYRLYRTFFSVGAWV